MNQTEHESTSGQAFVTALISIGYGAQQAAEIQLRTTQVNETTAIGAWNMHATPAEITEMWERAVRSGATRLVLDISLSGSVTDEGKARVNITVLDRDGPPNQR
jgi:hypothetical protein